MKAPLICLVFCGFICAAVQGAEPRWVEDAVIEQSKRALVTIEFFKARNAASVMRLLRAVLRRARLDAREAKLLRAMAIEVRKFFDRIGRR